MFEYIGNKIVAYNIDEWKYLLKNYSSQIISHPESKRPYSDLSKVAIQIGSFYDINFEENLISTSFENINLSLKRRAKYSFSEISIINDKNLIRIIGDISVGSTKQIIYQRELFVKKTREEQFTNISPENYDLIIIDDETISNPKIKSLTEISRGFFND